MRNTARAAGVGMVLLICASSASAQAPTTASPPPPPKEQAQAKPPVPPDKFHAKTGELRAAVLIGATVSNDQKQDIGTLSDILIDQNDKVTSAVLSVGGFLGVGSRLVIVPFADLRLQGDKIVLPGATKVSLENLSAYQAGG